MSNELPKDWKCLKMGEIFTIERGGSPRPIEDFVTEDSNGINWIKIGDTKGVVKYIYKTKEKIKPAGASRSRMVYEDDFILSNSMSFGKPFIMKTTGCIHDGWLVIRKNETIDNNFLYYILSSPIVFQQFTKLAKGSTVKNLNIEAVKQVELRIPPKPTQQAIVSKIEELFSEIENGIKSLFTAQQQLKTYRQSVLKWAFEGKLSLNYDLNDEMKTMMKADNNHSPSVNPKNHSSDKGKLPEGWEWKRIEEVATVGTGATPLKSKSAYYGGNIPWVTSGALNNEYVREATDFVTEKAVKETNLTVYPKHTLLVAMYGEGKTRGKCSELLIEACTNQAIAAIFFDEKEISIKPYLKYFLLKNYTDVRKKSSGGVQPNLNLGIIKKLQFPLAPIDEQQKIIQEIETRFSVADKMEESINQSLQQAEALRQSILKKAFEGKLV